MATNSPPGERFASTLFWLFCFVIFSKLIWYHATVYLPFDARRDYQVIAHTAWIIAQALVYLPIAAQLTREVNRVVAFWVILAAPYLLVGVWSGQLTPYVVNDVARYAMPVGFLLFGFWAVKHVPVATMIKAVATSLAVCMVIRLLVHLALADRPIRYGVNWEVLLPSLLAAMAYLAAGWRFAGVIVAIVIAVMLMTIGLTRSTLLGSVAAGCVVGCVGLWGLRGMPAPSLRMCAAAAVVVALAGLPLVLPAPLFYRLSLTGAVSDANTSLVADIFTVPLSHNPALPDTPPLAGTDPARSPPENSGLAAAAPGPPGASSDPRADRDRSIPREGDQPIAQEPLATAPSSDNDRVAAARALWEQAIATGNRSGVQRIAEVVYFLELARRDWRSLLLGAGAGAFVTVGTPYSEIDMVVRGSHVTPVTLLYRHGIVLGTLLFCFVAFYGLWSNFRQLASVGSPDWRVFLTALIAYRIAAIGMAFLHQGLFDDPIVFLAIAVAVALPTPRTEAHRGAQVDAAPAST